MKSEVARNEMCREHERAADEEGEGDGEKKKDRQRGWTAAKGKESLRACFCS